MARLARPVKKIINQFFRWPPGHPHGKVSLFLLAEGAGC
jgi:hypothetical protein